MDHASLGRHQHQGRDGGDDEQYVGAQGVDAVLDPPGRCPAAEFVADGARITDLDRQRGGNGEAQPGCNERHAPGRARPLHQYAQGPGQQWDYDHQNRQVIPETHSPSPALSAGSAFLHGLVIGEILGVDLVLFHRAVGLVDSHHQRQSHRGGGHADHNSGQNQHMR